MVSLSNDLTILGPSVRTALVQAGVRSAWVMMNGVRADRVLGKGTSRAAVPTSASEPCPSAAACTVEQ